MNLTREEAQKICAVFLLTDGHVKHRRSRNKLILNFYGKDESLHRAYKEFMELGFERQPSYYCSFDRSKRVFVTGYEFNEHSDSLKRFNSFSPTYTTKGIAGKEPSITFLFNEKREVQSLAFRIAMSTEGSIGISFHRFENRLEPRLRLACTSPTLVQQWQTIASKLGIEMNLDMDKASWSGIHGLRTSKKESILNFCAIGGFYPRNVKISRGKHDGLKKNALLFEIKDWLTTGFLTHYLKGLISKNKQEIG